MSKTKTKPPKGYAKTPGAMLRTNRFYVQLMAYGHVDERGKAVMSARGFDKWIADPDKPLSALFIKMFVGLYDAMDYSSRAAQEADLNKFKEFVSELELESNRRTRSNRIASEDVGT
jgi:hypothetical protein